MSPRPLLLRMQWIPRRSLCCGLRTVSTVVSVLSVRTIMPMKCTVAISVSGWPYFTAHIDALLLSSNESAESVAGNLAVLALTQKRSGQTLIFPASVLLSVLLYGPTARQSRERQFTRQQRSSSVRHLHLRCSAGTSLTCSALQLRNHASALQLARCWQWTSQ